jgi:sporulation protein YlmC with PRC-barrel domain
MPIHPTLLPVFGVALISAPVLAQPNQPTKADASAWITQLQPDQWRASDLERLDVYSSNNGDKIGDINELILDINGKVQAAVIGIGGYLGIGEREIAVPFDQIRFVNEPRVNASGTTTGEARLAGASPGGGTVASPAATGTAAVPAGSNSPATLNATGNNAPAPGQPGAPATEQTAPAVGHPTPNHAILMMSITRDELRTAPEFRAHR